MTKSDSITGWLSFLKTILLKPTWEFATTGLLFTLLSVTTWWRDNFASDEWKRRLELKGFLPHWSAGWWVSIGLCVVLLLVVREAHALWSKERAKVDALSEEVPLPESAPEVSITLDRLPDLGPPEALLIQNVGNDNIHSIMFEPFLDGSQIVMWRFPKFPLVRPHGIMQVVPVVILTGDEGAVSKSFVGFSEYLRIYGERVPSERPLVPLGEIKFTCSDRRDYRYEISASLIYTRLEHKVSVSSVERRLIRSRPGKG